MVRFVRRAIMAAVCGLVIPGSVTLNGQAPAAIVVSTS